MASKYRRKTQPFREAENGPVSGARKAIEVFLSANPVPKKVPGVPVEKIRMIDRQDVFLPGSFQALVAQSRKTARKRNGNGQNSQTPSL